MDIVAIPQLSDNYAWLLTRPDTRECAVVDPAEAGSVSAAVADRGGALKTILATHHHFDHVGGVEELVAAHGCEVIGSVVDLKNGRVPAQTRGVADGERLHFLGQDVECLLVPGHTSGAVAFHFPAAGAVFTGDTLFLAGCGRLFEGTPAQMHASLKKLKALPPETLVYCGHEYTENNLRFAESILPDDAGIQDRLASVAAARARGEPSVPVALSVELATSPFLRAEDPVVAAAVGASDPLAAFTEVRQRRDRW